MCRVFFCASEFMEEKILSPSILYLGLVKFLFSRTLQQKSHCQDSWNVDHLKRVLFYNDGSDTPGHRNKRGARRLLKQQR